MIYCETERLILRDWHEDDLLPFQKRFFIFYGGKVKLPAFFNTQKAQLPL
ncbi:Acetyltransferase GNAT family [Staphylococcus aureus]|nr:Acetyltransferase GNAT family [Staphylococcus aureus]